MNKIVFLCLVLTISLIVFSFLYFIPYFSKKKIEKGKFDILQFINLFFVPLLIIPILYFMKKIITQNPHSPLLQIDKVWSDLGFMSIVYFIILGNGIHSVSVVLQKHMKDLKHHKVWKINEFFHNGFSHLLLFFFTAMLFLSYTFIELNYPNVFPLSDIDLAILIFSGIISGIFFGIAVIEGSVPYVMFVTFYIISLIIPFMFLNFNLHFRRFPMSTFTEIMSVFAVITISVYRYRKKGFPEIVPHIFFED